MAMAASAAASSPIRSCRWAAATASARPVAHRSSVVTVRGDGSCEIRTSRPVSDWFLPSTTAAGPKWDIPKMPPLQYRSESCGGRTAPQTVVSRKPQVARSAERQSRWSTKYRTNTPGTTLVPAASPTSHPRCEERITRQSITTAAMRYRFTWPSSMVLTNGSRAIPATATSARCLHGSRSRQPKTPTTTR
jgi:hypothetical protein